MSPSRVGAVYFEVILRCDCLGPLSFWVFLSSGALVLPLLLCLSSFFLCFFREHMWRQVWIGYRQRGPAELELRLRGVFFFLFIGVASSPGRRGGAGLSLLIYVANA